MTRVSSASATRAPRQAGFTMIEVVAAVVLLGVWFTVLITIVTEGVATETLNRVRLEASLIADEALGDAEAALLARGSVKKWVRGDEHPYGKYADAEFDVLVSAVPFNPIENLSAREGAPVQPGGLGLDVSKLPEAERAAALAALLEIRVEVFASEGEYNALELDGEPERPLASRTSYVIDPIVIEALTIPQSSTGDGIGLDGSERDGPLGSTPEVDVE